MATAIATVLVLSLTIPILAVSSARQISATDAAASVIARYRARIPGLMAEQAIPGLAVALVDADEALWVEGFGHLDGPDSAKVTPDTIFSVQSMSKLFTATAVMQAAAADRLDLDEPITTYLPEFTVHSAFEDHPEARITLRMLLSHTAGFTHEAPIGNNYELDPGDFDAHVKSISDTWLRFPVGSGYAYSNLGIDLAGYILQQVEGKPFTEVMRDSLLAPLSMDHSTFDRETIRSSADRAVGHLSLYPTPPVDVPMTAAGGLYASAADLARFLRFQLNDGSIDGRVVLDPQAMEEMRTVPAPHAGAPAGYALGVARHRWNRWDQRPDLFDHGGGGYGFLSDLWWSPQLGIGVAVLTNSTDHQMQGDLPLSILADLLTEPGVYRDRLLALPSRSQAMDPGRFEPPTAMPALVAQAAMSPRPDEASRWSEWIGEYGAPSWGVIDPTAPAARFFVEDSVPYFETNEEGTLEHFRLFEIERGVFLAENGETLDLSGPIPTWRSVRLVRLTGGPAPWQWAILATAAFLAAGWLMAAAVRTFRRVRSRSRPASESKSVRRWPPRIAAALATITSLVTLAAVALIVWMPGLVDSGFLGWLNLPMVERLAFHLPLALAILGGSTLVLTAVGWVGHWWTSAVKVQYAALTVATVAFVAQLAVWHLIAWGMA